MWANTDTTLALRFRWSYMMLVNNAKYLIQVLPEPG